MKNLLIDFADWMAGFAKDRAKHWLNRSRWWSDFAESIETGEVRKQREDGEKQ